MRARIYRSTVDERLANKYKEVFGLNTKQAWDKVKLVTLKSNLNYIQ